jgi:hypothetical protein
LSATPDRTVQVDSSNNILVRMQCVADIIGVIDDVEREYQSPNRRIYDLDNPDTLAQALQHIYPLCGKNIIMNPARTRAHNPPNKKGPMPEKSHFD